MPSYYTPTGTVGTFQGPTGQPILYQGEPGHTVVVASDWGRTVEAIRAGGLVWRHEQSTSWPRGLALHERLLWVARGRDLMLINPVSGRELKYWTDIVPAHINGLSVGRENGVDYLTLAIDAQGTQTVFSFRIDNLNLVADHFNPHHANHPRSGYRLGGWMFVSDTFGEHVYAYDIASGGMRGSTPAFYPNHIEPGDTTEEVRIAEEHANRVLIWNTTTNERRVEVSAPLPLFQDPANGPAEIKADEAATFGGDLDPQKSLCAVECQPDALTLYSPNSATMTPHGLLIADTDNHRVILIRHGVVVLEITGFNNPVNAVLI